MKESKALIAALVLVSLQSFAADKAPYYNEVFDSSGNPRPQYREVYDVYSKMKTEEKERFVNNSVRDFKGDNALDPFPRLLTQSEYDVLRKGVEQRATALRMFLQDYYAGTKTYTKVIPDETLERIVSRSGELALKGKVKPETIAFPYGPDIIRTPEGRWAVIEDNPGYIGGIGDLGMAHESMLKNQPKYASSMKLLHDPQEYYSTVVARAKSRANNGAVVLLCTPPYPDYEDARIAKHLHDLGVIPVTPMTGRKLVVKSDGVYLHWPAKGNLPARDEKVGFIFLNSEHKYVDARNPAVRQTLRLSEAQGIVEDEDPAETIKLREALKPDPETGKIDMKKLRGAMAEWETDLPELRKFSVPGLTEAILKGKVAVNYSPGVDFIGDKEFYTYVDDLVRHYLHEEPAVTNLTTSRFTQQTADGKLAINQGLVDHLFKDGQYRDYVIKVVDGRGGDGVWIGPKLKQSEAAELLERIKANPESFIAQKYTHLSVVQPGKPRFWHLNPEEGRIVDLRLITDVGPKDAYVTRTPWGRGLPMGGNGKVNLSDRGREFMVGVVADPPISENTLTLPQKRCFGDRLRALFGF